MSKEAIEHYEAALKEAFPSGATGDVFYHWNEARKALAEQPAQHQCKFPMCHNEEYQQALAEQIERELVGEQPAQQECRTDGRCQYAIDSGAEGMGHCPKGKCIMPAQQQEPVAWMYQCSADSSGPVLMQNKRDWAESSSGLWTETPLYKSPPASKPLTDKEIYKIANDLFYGNGPCDTLAMCRAIEAAHNIKGDA